MSSYDEGLMTHDGASLLLEVFLVRLVLQLELFMSFLFPKSHLFFLFLLSCHLSALRSFVTLLDFLPHSLFYVVLSSMMNELCHLCAMLLEFVMSLVHLRFEFIS